MESSIRQFFGSPTRRRGAKAATGVWSPDYARGARIIGKLIIPYREKRASQPETEEFSRPAGVVKRAILSLSLSLLYRPSGAPFDSLRFNSVDVA